MSVEVISANMKAEESKYFDDDAALMRELASGSGHAMRMIVERWKNPLINFFYRSVHNLATAEDLTQQTFINLYKARAAYVVRSKFSTYLFQIARNLFINEYRKSLSRPQSVELIINADTDKAADNNAVETKELEELFDLAIAKLPENQRTAILLLKQQELTYEEIADVMNASVGAVKTWIHRARTALKQELEDKI